MATADQYLLCEEFSQALAAFRSEQWHEAARLFQAILEQFPNDGPSRFYLERSRRYARQPPESGEPAVVHLETK